MDPDLRATDRIFSQLQKNNNLGLKMSCIFHRLKINFALFTYDSQDYRFRVYLLSTCFV